MATTTLRKDFFELDFTVIALLHEYYVEYTIYDIEGIDDNKNPVWHKKNSPVAPDSVEKLSEAQIYLHGTVKFDGCSDWYFDEQDSCMLHGCSREGISRFGEIMAICWDWTGKLIPEKWYP